MKKITILLTLILTLMLSVSCDSDDSGGTGNTPPKEWVGVWLSAGTDVAPLLVAVFSYDSVRVTMTDDGLVTTESHVTDGAWTTINGTFSVTESATATDAVSDAATDAGAAASTVAEPALHRDRVSPNVIPTERSEWRDPLRNREKSVDL